LWPLHSAAQYVLDRSAALRRFLEPPRIAIVGPPNAGKSTLANALLGRAVSITHHEPGTTRDWVDAATAWPVGGARNAEAALPVVLVDTAGIRATPDALEAEAMAQAQEQMRQADVLVVVLDGAAPLEAGTEAWLAGLAADATPVVLVLNKSDLAAASVPSWGVPMIRISALQHENLEALITAVLAELDLADVGVHEPLAFTQRQVKVIHRLAIAADVGEARGLLQDLLGLVPKHGACA